MVPTWIKVIWLLCMVAAACTTVWMVASEMMQNTC